MAKKTDVEQEQQIKSALQKLDEKRAKLKAKERKVRVHRMCSAVGVMERILKDETGTSLEIDDALAREIIDAYILVLHHRSGATTNAS